MKLKDITLLEYHTMDDKSEYDFAARFSRRFNEPLDLFQMGELTKRSFGFVKDLQYNFANGINIRNLINFAHTLSGIPEKDLVQYKFIEWIRFRAYLQKSLKDIQKLEEHLKYESSGQDEESGIERLSKFGVMIQIDNLAKGDILKYDTVREMPYEICFTKLLMDKEIQEYIKERTKLKK